MQLNTQNTLIKILQENPPMYSSDLYEIYRERAGSSAISKAGFRRSLSSLISNGFVHRGKEWTERKGYLHTLASKPTPVAGASHSSVQFGNRSLEPSELLKALYTGEHHPFFSSYVWDNLRLDIILLMLGAPREGFREKLLGLRDSLTRTLGQVNTIIDGELWSVAKQDLIRKDVPNSDSVILVIRQFLDSEIDRLPEW